MRLKPVHILAFGNNRLKGFLHSFWPCWFNRKLWSILSSKKLKTTVVVHWYGKAGRSET
jgi:hypothetical protein